LAVHRHVDVQTAKLIAQKFRRYLTVRNLELPNAFKRDFEQLRDEALEQVRVSRKQCFEQRIIRKRVFQFGHSDVPLQSYYATLALKAQQETGSGTVTF
jgi:hypothetical protein